MKSLPLLYLPLVDNWIIDDSMLAGNMLLLDKRAPAPKIVGGHMHGQHTFLLHS